MITFGEIIEKSIHVKFVKTDIENYRVNGYASYNKANKLDDASGTIENIGGTSYVEGIGTCDFNIYRNGEDYRMNINNVNVGSGAEMNAIVESVLDDLKGNYPEE